MLYDLPVVKPEFLFLSQDHLDYLNDLLLEALEVDGGKDLAAEITLQCLDQR